MRYVALRTFAMHIERVKLRADAGGHSASEALLEGIYQASIGNLSRAIREIDYLDDVYDNSKWGVTPTILLQTDRGEIVYEADEMPEWLVRALNRG